MNKAIVLGLAMALMATPAFADFAGPNAERAERANDNKDSPYVPVPWNHVINGFKDQGEYSEDSFINRWKNKWHVWQSNASHDTLIWSKDTNLGYNCSQDSRTNFWGRCESYSLSTGKRIGYVSVSIRNGNVQDHKPERANRDDCYCRHD